MLINKKAMNALADLRVWLDTLEDVEELILAVVTEEGVSRDQTIEMFEIEGEDKIRTAAFTFANNVIDFDQMHLMTLLTMISKNFHA